MIRSRDRLTGGLYRKLFCLLAALALLSGCAPPSDEQWQAMLGQIFVTEGETSGSETPEAPMPSIPAEAEERVAAGDVAEEDTGTSTHPSRSIMERALSDAAFPVPQLLREGWDAFERGETEQALNALEEAAGAAPGRPEPPYVIGWIYHVQGDYANALVQYDRALALDPALTEAYIAKGWVRYEQGDSEGALEEYQLALEQGERLAEIYTWMAEAYFALEDLAQVVAAADEAIALDPEADLAHYYRGWSRARMGDLVAAEDDLNRALILNPGSLDYRALRMLLYWFTDQNGLAAADADWILSRFPTQDLSTTTREQAHVIRGTQRMADHEPGPAIEDLREALRINPWNLEVYGMLIRLEDGAALYDARLAEVQAQLGDGDSPGIPDYVAGMEALLKAQLLGAPEEALAAVHDFDAAISADPVLAAAYHGRGVARILGSQVGTINASRFSSGDGQVSYDDATTGETVTMSQEEYDALLAANAAAAESARSAAAEDLNQALALVPDEDAGLQARILHDLGVILFARPESFWGMNVNEPIAENRDQALAYLNQAVETDPTWPQARLSRMLVDHYWALQLANEAENPAVLGLSVASAGSSVAVQRLDRVELWDLEGRELVGSVPSGGLEPDPFHAGLYLNPDGSRLLTRGHSDGVLRLWDTETGTEIQSYPEHDGFDQGVIFSPDGARLAAADAEGRSRVWSVEDGSRVDEFPVKPPLVFTPDGRQIVGVEEEGNLAVWDLVEGSLAARLLLPAEALPGPDTDAEAVAPVAVAIRSDGAQLAAVFGEGLLALWPLATLDGVLEASTVQGLEEGLFRPELVFSETGQALLLIHDDTVYRVDAVTWETSQILDDGSISYLELQPRLGLLVAAPHAGAIRLLDGSDGEELALLDALTPAQEELAAQARQYRERARADAEVLIAQEAGAGWPYFVRAMTSGELGELIRSEADEAVQAQFEADLAQFSNRSPNVRLDDTLYESVAAVQVGGALPASPTTKGHLEAGEEGRRLYVLEEAGFALQIPDLGPIPGIRDAYVPDGPAFVRISDDFRIFQVLAIPGELDELSPSAWITQELGAFGLSDFTFWTPIETEYGPAAVVYMPEVEAVAAVLPAGGYLFYVELSRGGTGAMMFDEMGVGANAERERDSLADFVQGLQILGPN